MSNSFGYEVRHFEANRNGGAGVPLEFGSPIPVAEFAATCTLLEVIPVASSANDSEFQAACVRCKRAARIVGRDSINAALARRDCCGGALHDVARVEIFSLR